MMKRLFLVLLCLAFWLPAGASMVHMPYVQNVQAGMIISGSGGGGGTPGSGDYYTAASGDDTGYDGSTFSTTSAQVKFGCGEGNDIYTYLRFVNVTVPSGATITAASITGTVDAAGDSAVYWRVYGIEGDTAQADIDSDADTPTLTAAYEDMDNVDASGWASESTQTLAPDNADFRSVVQEVVDTSWTSGYDMAFKLDGNDPDPASNWDAKVEFRSYDYSSTTFTLSLEWTN